MLIARWTTHAVRAAAQDERGSTRGSACSSSDDHAVVRRGLRGFFELLDDIEVVGEAEDGRAGGGR